MNYLKDKGSSVNLTAKEWNDQCDLIEKQYKTITETVEKIKKLESEKVCCKFILKKEYFRHSYFETTMRKCETSIEEILNFDEVISKLKENQIHQEYKLEKLNNESNSTINSLTNKISLLKQEKYDMLYDIVELLYSDCYLTFSTDEKMEVLKQKMEKEDMVLKIRNEIKKYKDDLSNLNRTIDIKNKKIHELKDKNVEYENKSKNIMEEKTLWYKIKKLFKLI